MAMMTTILTAMATARGATMRCTRGRRLAAEASVQAAAEGRALLLTQTPLLIIVWPVQHF